MNLKNSIYEYKFFVFLLIIFFVLFFWVAFQVFGLLDHKSNKDLGVYLLSNYQDMSDLVGMIELDEVEDVVVTWNIGRNKMSESRWVKYVDYLNRLDLASGVHKQSDKVYFPISVSKSGGTVKGLAYSYAVGEQDFGVLCCLPIFALFSGDLQAYKYLGGGWYIFYSIEI